MHRVKIRLLTYFEQEKLVRLKLGAQFVHYLQVRYGFAGLDRRQRHGDLHFGQRLEVQAVRQVKRNAVCHIFYSLDVGHFEKVFFFGFSFRNSAM